MSNIAIRTKILQSGLKHYQVAEAVGVTPETFSSWLRKELTGDRLERVERAIEELLAEETTTA